MNFENWISELQEFYQTFKQSHNLSLKEMASLFGLDRRMFLRLMKGNHYSNERQEYRMLRRLIKLLEDPVIKDRALQWLKDIVSQEMEEDWHHQEYDEMINNRKYDDRRRRGTK